MGRFVIGLLLLCLIACGSSNLSQVDLPALLVQDGDLPDTLAPDQLTSVWIWGDEAPRPDRFLNRTFSHDGQPAGIAQIALYSSTDTLAQAYTGVHRGQGGEPLAGVGTQASSYDSGIAVGAQFVRCHALVSVQLVKDAGATMGILLHYLQRLDQRVSAATC